MWKHDHDEERYFVLEGTYGERIYLAHGTFQRLVWFHDIDLRAEWDDYRMSVFPFYRPNNSDFLDHLGGKLIDPESAEDLSYCGDCERPVDDDDLHSVLHGDKYVCEDCTSSYFHCEWCDEYVGMYDYTWVESEGTSYCEDCVESNFSYCEYCDGYFDMSDHYHDDDCNCESPVQQFTVRNDGEDPLANDTAATVSLPAGVISDVGMSAMTNLFIRHSSSIIRPWNDKLHSYNEPGYLAAREEYGKWYNLAYDIQSEMDTRWQTKEGNFTKRLSRYAFKTYGLKVPPALLSEVGNIGNQHSQGKEFNIELTRDLNLPAGAFAHDDSCYWQSYASSRCTLKSNGAFGLRSFEHGKDNSWSQGCTGRAWVMPLKYNEEGSTETDRYGRTRGIPPFEPTFETESPDAYIVFNGYGDLGGYSPARIMAHMTGMTYRKVEFYGGEMYINAGGYLVAPEEIADKFTDGRVELSIDPHSDLFAREQVRKDKAAKEAAA